MRLWTRKIVKLLNNPVRSSIDLKSLYFEFRNYIAREEELKRTNVDFKIWIKCIFNIIISSIF